MDRERLSAADQLTMIFCWFHGSTVDISWQPGNNTVPSIPSTLYMYALHIILVPGSLYRVSRLVYPSKRVSPDSPASTGTFDHSEGLFSCRPVEARYPRSDGCI